jgi:DNA-binding NarL/FixJ family response regulator
MIYRVLLVDDHDGWRHQVRSVLEQTSRWSVAAEASDGPDAIHKAREHRPDLIVLDVGLPSLNGIEVARRILAHDPSAKILFLSEHGSPDIVDAALGTGAHGYVVKTDASRELLRAMCSIVERQRAASPVPGRLVDTGR